MDDDPSRNDRRSIRRALAIFAAIVVVTAVAALAATIHGIDRGQTTIEQPPGTIGLTHPHPALDKGPGENLRP
jgi:hypothetical protein